MIYNLDNNIKFECYILEISYTKPVGKNAPCFFLDHIISMVHYPGARIIWDNHKTV